MRISILPKTLSGWWSAGLVIASLILFVLSVVILGPGPDYNMALAYTLTIIIAMISAAILVMGLIGIIKSKERAVLVFLAMVVGVYTLFGCITGLLGLQK